MSREGDRSIPDTLIARGASGRFELRKTRVLDLERAPRTLWRYSPAAAVVLLDFAWRTGDAPTLGFSLDEAALTRGDCRRLAQLIEDAWRDLAIRCRCGHTFARHAANSPHPCAAADCPAGCLVFQATDPPFASEPPEVP